MQVRVRPWCDHSSNGVDAFAIIAPTVRRPAPEAVSAWARNLTHGINTNHMRKT